MAGSPSLTQNYALDMDDFEMELLREFNIVPHPNPPTPSTFVNTSDKSTAVAGSSTDSSQMDFTWTNSTPMTLVEKSAVQPQHLANYFTMAMPLPTANAGFDSNNNFPFDMSPSLHLGNSATRKGKQSMGHPVDDRMDLAYPIDGEFAAVQAPSTIDIEQYFATHNITDKRLRKLFQVMDSLIHHHRYTDLVPSSSQFRFDADVKQFGRIVQSWLILNVKNGPGLDRIERYRPDGRALPVIPAIPLPPEPLPFCKGKQPMEEVPANTQLDLPTLQELMLYDDDVTDNWLLFFNHAHSLALRQEYQAINNQADLTQKTEVPQDIPLPDSAEYKDCVKRLYRNMQDFSTCIEKDKKEVKAAKVKHQDGTVTGGQVIGHEDALQAKRVKDARRIIKELAACDILDAAIEAHKGNVWINDWTGTTGWGYEDYETWDDRFQHILGAVKHSKAVIDNVMKFTPLRRFAAAPAKEYGRKFNNFNINKLRDQQVKIGIHALRAGAVQVAADQTIIAPGGQVVHAPPPAVTVPRPTTVTRGRKRAKGSDGQAHSSA